jgi:hypothetical protein
MGYLSACRVKTTDIEHLSRWKEDLLQFIWSGSEGEEDM